ncbi:hypothetical protein [Hydrogenovibrio marinus]|uniref:Toprim domain-containing protein n=1 Tax=Hydrogenovibrio marinus TaxID=28885 RepID=A0A066ZWJ7_HYDMR|nr:hypothetical protein [Hydrogenovibrio marinus]KDN94691.1 hypothetical protein EI16_12390 [Hydrogenovibrio marinus]
MTTLTLEEHLAQRDFNTSLYPTLWLDESERVVTFPLWNLSGQLVGYQQYRPEGSKEARKDPKEGKYFTYVTPEGERYKKMRVWGLERLDPSKRVVYLLEGVFKACRFHNAGLNALATLGNDPKDLKEWLGSLGYFVVPVCDGDKPGKKLSEYGNKAYCLEDGVYVDDLDDNQLQELLNELEKL